MAVSLDTVAACTAVLKVRTGSQQADSSKSDNGRSRIRRQDPRVQTHHSSSPETCEGLEQCGLGTTNEAAVLSASAKTTLRSSGSSSFIPARASAAHPNGHAGSV